TATAFPTTSSRSAPRWTSPSSTTSATVSSSPSPIPPGPTASRTSTSTRCRPECSASRSSRRTLKAARSSSSRRRSTQPPPSGTAMSMRVFPQAQDRLNTAYLNDWLKTPWVSLDDERGSCVHCYGGAWWWLYLTGLSPKVLPRYLADLATDQARGVSTTLGVT